MRWLFYGLVIANLAFLGWHLAVRPVADAGEVQTAAPAPRSLQLLSERSTDARPLLEVRAAVQGGADCWALGPWADAQMARLWQGGHPQVRGADLQALSVRRDALHWVYLPAPGRGGRSTAMATLRTLQSAGVDSFIVTEGEDENAISLGFFSRPDSARGLQMKMRTAGYPAEIRETWRDLTEYWLYLPVASGVDETVLRTLMEQGGLRLERARCSSH